MSNESKQASVGSFLVDALAAVFQDRRGHTGNMGQSPPAKDPATSVPSSQYPVPDNVHNERVKIDQIGNWTPRDYEDYINQVRDAFLDFTSLLVRAVEAQRNDFQTTVTTFQFQWVAVYMTLAAAKIAAKIAAKKESPPASPSV
jgi:hypothetical protein